MEEIAYNLMGKHEITHWWFRARRVLLQYQIEKSMSEQAVDKTRCRILDYGCGTTYNLRFLSKFGHVDGADVSSLNSTLFSESKDYQILDLESDLSSYKNMYHIVCALDVVEHLEDDVIGLVEIGAFLKKNGQAIIMTPAYEWLWGEEDELSHHKRRYTKRHLESSINKAGFEIKYLSYFMMPLVLPMVVFNVVKKYSATNNKKGNLFRLPTPINETLFGFLRLEAVMIGSEKIAAPFGSSLMARIRKRD